jgi:hypothetical protein
MGSAERHVVLGDRCSAGNQDMDFAEASASASWEACPALDVVMCLSYLLLVVVVLMAPLGWFDMREY